MMSTGDSEHTTGADDAALLARVAHLWQQVDPPPADLADGVLARIAAEDLEFDLLVLVESQGALSGVRSAAEDGPADTSDEATGAWSLDYAGADFNVYLRLTRIEDRTRLDGWVVPARPLTVRLLAEDGAVRHQTALDEFGRFEIAETPTGFARLSFVDETPTADRPRITPPFWI
jgi:hypothetical protein